MLHLWESYGSYCACLCDTYCLCDELTLVVIDITLMSPSMCLWLLDLLFVNTPIVRLKELGEIHVSLVHVGFNVHILYRLKL
jgi:hypothetical protein